MRKILLGFFALFSFASFAQSPVYNQFSCGGDINGSGCTWNNQVISNGAVTLAKQANFAATSIRCNTTTSAATGQDCLPVAVANLMNGVMGVIAVNTVDTAIPSGLPKTIDGVSITNGQPVLFTNITGGVGNGIYIAKTSGAWTRSAQQFPAGYVIAQNCVLLIDVAQGTTFGGTIFQVTTTSSITIGTTSISIVQRPYALASSGVNGIVETTDGVSAQPVAVVNLPPDASGDCVSFTTGNDGLLLGDIGDIGGANGTGPCVTSDSNGHIIFGGVPTVTGSGCSRVAGVTRDNTGTIVATGADTCTVTFSGAFVTAPNCAVGNIGTSVQATLSLAPTTAHVIFVTQAAGSFNYVCM